MFRIRSEHIAKSRLAGALQTGRRPSLRGGLLMPGKQAKNPMEPSTPRLIRLFRRSKEGKRRQVARRLAGCQRESGQADDVGPGRQVPGPMEISGRQNA